MRPAKKILRNVILPTAMVFKGDWLVRGFSNHTMLNLMYHGVVNRDQNNFTPRHLHIKQFEKQLIYLKRNFDIVSIAEAFKMYRNNIRPKRKTISITFDDGYANNLLNAVPLLEKYEIKATIFVLGMCAEEMEIRALWADILASLRFFDKDSQIEIDGLVFTNYLHESSNLRLRDYIKTLSYEQRDVVMESLIKDYDLKNKIMQVPEEAWSLLRPDELLKLSNSKYIDIGSHAYRHFNLANIDLKDVEFELRQSKTIIENLIQRPVTQIAYPDGSYSSQVKDVAEKCGYRNQLAVGYRSKEDEADARILNRHGISSTTTYESNMLSVNRAFGKKGYL